MFLMHLSRRTLNSPRNENRLTTMRGGLTFLRNNGTLITVELFIHKYSLHGGCENSLTEKRLQNSKFDFKKY